MIHRLACGAVVVLAACSGGGGGGTTSTIGPPDRATAVEVPLRVGQCADHDRIRAGVAVDPGALRIVDCSQPHAVEVAAVLEYPAGQDFDFPGTTAVDSFATDECLQRFTGYVGVAYEASQLDFAIVAPDEAGWDDGDRRIACLLYHVDFSPLTGSVAGTGT